MKLRQPFPGKRLPPGPLNLLALLCSGRTITIDEINALVCLAPPSDPRNSANNAILRLRVALDRKISITSTHGVGWKLEDHERWAALVFDEGAG